MERLEPRSDWIPTDHPRVFYKEKADKFDRGELEIAKLFADSCEEWTVVITMGPWRGYDIRYELLWDNKIIHLDFYSVRLPDKKDVFYSIQEVMGWIEERRLQTETPSGIIVEGNKDLNFMTPREILDWLSMRNVLAADDARAVEKALKHNSFKVGFIIGLVMRYNIQGVRVEQEKWREFLQKVMK